MLTAFAGLFSGWGAAAGGAWTWFKKSPVAQWALGLALAFIGYSVWKRNVEAGVRRQEREAQGRREAQAEIAVVRTSNKVIEEVRNARDEAVAAGDALPEFAGPRELRDAAPDIAAELFRSGGR